MDTFIYIPAISTTSFITLCTSTIERTLVGVALSVDVAAAASVQASVFTHTCPLRIHVSQTTGTTVRTRSVVAGHVLAASGGLLTFIHIVTNDPVTMVSVYTLAEVGAISVEAQCPTAAVVWPDRVQLAFVYILTVKSVPFQTTWADAGEGSRHVSADSNWVASSILVLAFIKVYNLSKMGQCQGSSPKSC